MRNSKDKFKRKNLKEERAITPDILHPATDTVTVNQIGDFHTLPPRPLAPSTTPFMTNATPFMFCSKNIVMAIALNVSYVYVRYICHDPTPEVRR